jgi:hypothetical protein
MYKYLIKTLSPKSPLLHKTDNPAFLSANKEVEELLYRSSSDNSPDGQLTVTGNPCGNKGTLNEISFLFQLFVCFDKI